MIPCHGGAGGRNSKINVCPFEIHVTKVGETGRENETTD